MGVTASRKPFIRLLNPTTIPLTLQSGHESGAGEMQAESSVRRDAPPSFVGSDELAEGLMLVRASALKMIRFQLAMERQDRRVALETVDDLVALDRRLEEYLADVPAPPIDLRRELEVERAALNREKLTLAAEVIRGTPEAVEPAPEPLAIEPVPAEKWEDFECEEPKRRVGLWLMVGFIVLSAVAAAAYWLVSSGLVAPVLAITGAGS
jgi:hypothetical protein